MLTQQNEIAAQGKELMHFLHTLADTSKMSRPEMYKLWYDYIGGCELTKRIPELGDFMNFIKWENPNPEVRG